MGLLHIEKTYKLPLCGAIFIIVLALMALVPTQSANAQFQENFEEEELILVATKDQYILSDGVIAIQREGKYYLPVIELAEMVEFVVDADLERGIIDGWYLSEDNKFSINTETGEIINQGERESLSEDDFILDNAGGGFGDLYLLQEKLNAIWPVRFDVDLYALALRIEAEGKLPFELQLERDERRELTQAKQRFAPTKRTDLPFIPNNYRLFGSPSLDFDTQAKWDDAEKEFTSRVNLNGTQDLLWAQADYNANLTYDADGNIQRPRNIRLRFLRQFFEEDAPLGIREIEVGDTRITAPDQIKNSVSGRGISISSKPVVKDRSFDEITIEGTARAGWEIELYRNNQLIEFGVVDDLGEYRFENVELNVGNNQFRLVFYGPQGQIEERTESYVISGGMLKPGETQYQLGIVDADRPFIFLENEPRTTSRGVAQEGTFSVGITNWLTMFGTANRLPRQGNNGEGQYLTVGGMFTGLGGVGQAAVYKEVGGGKALDLQFATNLLGVNLNLESAFFNDFESDTVGYDQGARTYDGTIRANKNFKLPFGSLGLSVDANHQKRKNDIENTKISTRQSFSRAGINISHTTNSSFVDRKHTNSTASLTATVRMQQWQVRSGLNYKISPDSEITSANAELRYRGDDSFSAAVSLQHNFLTSIISTGAQLSYDFGEFLGSVDADWQKERGFVFTLRASTSLGPFGDDGKYKFSSKKLSASAPVKAKIFLDNDYDGVFGEGDEPVEDAKILIDGRGNRDYTNEDGTVIVRRGAKGIRNVEVDKSSLPDPYFRPSTDGYSTLLRQGGMPYMEFPVIETGAIDGTVLNDSTGDPIEGMRLELVDAAGEVVAEAETAYDGFYTFEFIKPGDYVVRADPTYQVNVPPMSVSVASDDLFAYGIDLALMEQAKEALAATEGAEVSQEMITPSEAVSGESGGVAHTHHSKGTGQPAPKPTDGDFSAVVKRVRIGEHSNKARFVLDLSGPVNYTLSCKENCSQVQVDLPNVAWSAITRWRADKTPIIQSFDAEALAGGGTRITIKARGSMSVGLNGVLGPHQDAARGHRLYLDLQ
jgi:hypothetical protein